MKKRLLPLLAAAACAALLLAPRTPQAHALRAVHERQGETVLVRFAYSDGKAPEFAAVRVLDANGQEFQNGRTDARGRFAFVPDRPGLWRISISDGMGHKTEHAVEVGPADAPAAPAATAPAAPDTDDAPASLPLRAALGLSLLANLALLIALLRRRRV